jgi:hypothetical protein
LNNYTIVYMNRTIRVADEVWVATALLHREHADREDFSISEIVDRAEREMLAKPLRPGVRVHVTLHCVAALAPNPARCCMLHATASGRRRLWRPGDPIHPARVGGKVTPQADEIPEACRPLLDWYRSEYAPPRADRERAPAPDPLLELRGSGAEVWSGEHADDYVARLRSDWS